jgi:hypothetical protein
MRPWQLRKEVVLRCPVTPRPPTAPLRDERLLHSLQRMRASGQAVFYETACRMMQPLQGEEEEGEEGGGGQVVEEEGGGQVVEEEGGGQVVELDIRGVAGPQAQDLVRAAPTTGVLRIQVGQLFCMHTQALVLGLVERFQRVGCIRYPGTDMTTDDKVILCAGYIPGAAPRSTLPDLSWHSYMTAVENEFAEERLLFRREAHDLARDLVAAFTGVPIGRAEECLAEMRSMCADAWITRPRSSSPGEGSPEGLPLPGTKRTSSDSQRRARQPRCAGR